VWESVRGVRLATRPPTISPNVRFRHRQSQDPAVPSSGIPGVPGVGSTTYADNDAVDIANHFIIYMRSPGTQPRILSIYPEYEKSSTLALLKGFSAGLRGRRHTRAEALRKQIVGLYYEASGVRQATSPHQIDAFLAHLTEFRDDWFSGKYQAMSILK
jgi:hypothetical protein